MNRNSRMHWADFPQDSLNRARCQGELHGQPGILLWAFKPEGGVGRDERSGTDEIN